MKVRAMLLAALSVLPCHAEVPAPVPATLPNWSLPYGHFDGVDAAGHAAYATALGEIDLGEGEILPVVIEFGSDVEKSSPYLGKGWVLPLFESEFVQVSENAFRNLRPDGSESPFYRSNSSEQTLNGGSPQAKIEGEVITVTYANGWKNIYRETKLAQIVSPAGRIFHFEEEAGIWKRFCEGEKTLLSVEFDDSTHEGKAVIFNGNRVELQFGDRPRLEVVAGEAKVEGTDRTLVSFTNARADEFGHFVFAVDQRMRPTLEISMRGRSPKSHYFTWDRTTKQIISDYRWDYETMPSTDGTGNAPVARSAQGRRPEYWYDSASEFAEATRTEGDVTTVTRYYPASQGPLKIEVETRQGIGAPRKEMKLYDWNGRLLIDILPDLVTTYSFSPYGEEVIQRPVTPPAPAGS